MRKIITTSYCWTCSNMDLLAPIDWQGKEILFDNNERLLIEEWQEEAILQIFQIATNEEKKDFFRKYYRRLFVGDVVTITKGKMKGETKIVKSYFRFDVQGTYGHKYVDYIVFEDGTKTNVLNLNNKTAFGFNELDIFIGGRTTKDED